MLATYRSALTSFAQITHIMPPVTVQPLAMWLSMHLIQNFFLWSPIFRVCVTQNGNLDGLRGYLVAFIQICILNTAVHWNRHMYTHVLCLGWRVGIVLAIIIVTATAAHDCDLT